MNSIKGQRLSVPLSASQARRRLKGHGLGVRKIHSAGHHQAIIIHTATGEHLRQLRALLGLAAETGNTTHPDGYDIPPHQST